MNSEIQIQGKSTTLKNYANVHDTVSAIQRIIAENYHSVSELAQRLKASTDKETFSNIWTYVRMTVKYKNDEKGKEQLRTPQRTLHDEKGDCDDMSILISSILKNLGVPHELYITAYKKKDKWQHIYPVAYDNNGTRYVIDCVPEIPYFNYEAKPIKNKIIINMKLEELGNIDTEMINELSEDFDINSLIANDQDEISIIQGLLGNVVIVDEDEEYDTVISGSELKQNIIVNQIVDAKKALEEEVKNPSELSQLNDNKIELQLINNILENFDNEEQRAEAINLAISRNTLYKNFYKALQYGVSDLIEGFAGDDEDDIYYLKLMQEAGISLDEIINDGKEELGKGFFKKIRNKIKTGVQSFKQKHPKLSKLGHSLKKYSPATFAARRSLGVFLRANTFHISEKLAIGYITETEARKLGYSKTDWLKFVEGKNKAESKWYSLGGKKEHLRKIIMQGRGAKKAGIGELGVAPAVIAAVSKVFGGIIEFFKNIKLKKKNGTERPETGGKQAVEYSTESTTLIPEEDMEAENIKAETHEKSGVVTEITTDENGKETKTYKDKDGNEISKFKAFFLKNKTMLIIVSIVLVVGIVALIIWKAKRGSLRGLGSGELSKKQENYTRRQGLNSRAYAALVREEISKDGKSDNKTNRKSYYKKVFRESFTRPITESQKTAASNYNSMYQEVRKLAKAKGGGSKGWKEAWAEEKKKSRS